MQIDQTYNHVESEYSYLETYILPVCRFNKSSGSALVSAFYGTAFFINSGGTFLTAKHAIDDANQGFEEADSFIGLCVRPPGSDHSVACPIKSTEFVNPPYDICVGTIAENFPTSFTLGPISVSVWSEVATYGYPVSAQNRTVEEFWMYGRGFRGYLHREAKAGHLPLGKHPDAFETSFPMPPGLSGGPLFVHGSPKDVIIGVCVGVNRGETTDYLFEEVREDGSVTVERRVRLEEFGIAHDVRPLLEWRPLTLGGITLQEMANK